MQEMCDNKALFTQKHLMFVQETLSFRLFAVEYTNIFTVLYENI